MKFRYVFHPCKEQVSWGGHDDSRGLLEVGKVYEGEVEIHSSYSHIILDEFPDKKFNSVTFEPLDKKKYEAKYNAWRELYC